MAISISSKLPNPCKPTFSFFSLFNSTHHFPLIFSLRFLGSYASAAAAIETVDEIANQKKTHLQGREGKKYSSKELGISTSMISKPARFVLKGLRKNGYDVYLVGGCVRDLILKRIPKDFDVLTSAELREVMKTFPHAQIVGKRFPICHVHVGDSIVEVSSFNTLQRRYNWNLAFASRKPMDCEEKDDIRWRNCMQRDFTINGFMFDPYQRIVYDYMEGLVDIRKAKVRTIAPASKSFREDCARILRAVRIAARLGFRLSRETAQAVRDLSSSILRLDKGRLLMEMNYMLAYGSAEASVRLLWKIGLLELLLPHQAAYLVRSGFKRSDKESNMLLSLLANLDKLLAPDKPCHSSLWVAILAFHNALFTHARDPAVVAAFSLAIHNGGDVVEAVKISKGISRRSELSFPELLESQSLDETVIKKEVLDLAKSVNHSFADMTDEDVVSKAMAKYPQAPHSNLVFIPLGLQLRVCRIFDCVSKGKEKGFLPKQGVDIDYGMLALGTIQEARHVFARVVFDTLYPLSQIRLAEGHTISANH